MKKYALILAILLVFSMVGCVAQTPPEPTELTTNPTTAPTTESTTTPTTEPATEPTEPDPARPSEGPRHEGERLTKEELTQFELLFRPDRTPYASHPVNYYAMALCVEFDMPENLNLLYYFNLGFKLEGKEPITEEELDFFTQESGCDRNTMGDLYRLPAQRVNGILEYYFGLTAEQVTGWTNTGWIYAPDTDCFYFSPPGALLPGSVTFRDGYYDETTATVFLYYMSNERNCEYVVTLQSKRSMGETGYYILSNLPVE